jgi:hypothetical protein
VSDRRKLWPELHIFGLSSDITAMTLSNSFFRKRNYIQILSICVYVYLGGGVMAKLPTEQTNSYDCISEVTVGNKTDQTKNAPLHIIGDTVKVHL